MNSVLNSLPLYYFSLFRAPRKIINLLDSIRRRFLWGGDDDKKKINWVAWDTVNKPKDNGVLEWVVLIPPTWLYLPSGGGD